MRKPTEAHVLIAKCMATLVKEIRLLRRLEDAIRKADPKNCKMSLNTRFSLDDLDEFRSAQKRRKS